MDKGQLLIVDVKEKPYTMKILEDGKLIRNIDENGIGNNKGSAMFLHCFGLKGYTGGCVAVSRENMEFIMNFLDRDKQPKILIKR